MVYFLGCEIVIIPHPFHFDSVRLRVAKDDLGNKSGREDSNGFAPWDASDPANIDCGCDVAWMALVFIVGVLCYFFARACAWMNALICSPSQSLIDAACSIGTFAANSATRFACDSSGT